MSERIIVSLTTWNERINNIPTVLNTILEQSVKPDHIVLNLAYEEIIPNNIQSYLDKNHVEVFRTPDTKVYKKLIPTLRRYPNDIVISIDDDWLYPTGMIADFLETHRTHPDNPISGNRLVYHEMICHCGCASLTKAEYFQPYLDKIDDVIPFCPCDDIVYTYFANKAGHPYVMTNEEYFTNMTPYKEGMGYSESIGDNALRQCLSYLIENYGDIPHFPDGYVKDKYIANLIYLISEKSKQQVKKDTAAEIRTTYAYKIGRMILKPFSFFRPKA